jgi:hypothetical protein
MFMPRVGLRLQSYSYASHGAGIAGLLHCTGIDGFRCSILFLSAVIVFLVIH